MKLGAFSLSLAVKDIHASFAFYEKLGFEAVGGDVDQNWVILRNASTTLGLFQGMFEQNTLTFNPGWDAQGALQDDFEDIRDIQKRLKAHGMSFQSEADEATTGPAHFTLLDPDGNPVLVDQHI